MGSWAAAQSVLHGAAKAYEFDNSAHRATFRVESAELCPGQEVELGIYVDLRLGQSGGGTGSYGPGQLPPDPLDNFMFYIYISDTALAEVVCSSVDDRGNGYKVGYPVLTNLLPELSGGNLTCGYIVGSREGSLGKRGRFTCIWTRSRSTTQLIPDIHAPLFKIRVRLKAEGRVTIGIDDPNEIAFSTGLAQLGGYYYGFPNLPNQTPNRVPGVLTPALGPDKSKVSAGRDSLICIDSRITFNAEGGKSYRWSQVYNPAIQGGYQNEYLTNPNTKNPTFLPKTAGYFMYQVEAFDEKGCSTRDTVTYTVAQNTLRGTIDPNGAMIDSGSRVHFTLNGSTSYSSFKMKVALTPDSLFATDGNTLYSDGPSVSGSITTKSIYEPTLITATFSDGVCQEEIPAVIRINGLDVSGKIAPFPVYRCGNDRKIKSLQLNLLTRGGSDKFLYNWRATDLEFTDFPLAAPKIDKPNSRTPKLTYYGRCAVSVDIYDMVSGKTVTITDTMIYRDWLQASTEVSVDTAAFEAAGLSLEGPYCEGTEHTYKANSVYAGENARYIWQVNGLWKDEGINKDTYTAALNKGDSVSCVLYSTEACVATQAVESKPFALDIRYPVTPSIELASVGTDDCDNIRLQATCHAVGKRFRIQWFRNGNLELDKEVEADNYDYCQIQESFQSQGFYESFNCRVVASDMPCGFDTVHSTVISDGGDFIHGGFEDEVYPFVCTGNDPQVLGISMPEEAVCSDDLFTLTAQVTNLPEVFKLEWFKRSGGEDIPLGYYEYPLNDADYDIDYYLAQGENYGYGDIYSREQMLPVVRDGFRIILNNPNAAVASRQVFTPGDSVFFVLNTQSGGDYCACGVEKELRSPYFVPNLLNPSTPGAFTIDYVEKTDLCPSDEHIYHLVASLPGEDYYTLDWNFEGFSVTDSSEETGNPAQYFKLLGARGDTLQSCITVRPDKVHGLDFGTFGGCTATITKGCNAGQQYTATFNLNEYVLDVPLFRIKHSPDTIVCANQAVEHSVTIEEQHRDNSAKNPGNEKQYTVTWYTSLQDMLDEKNVAATGRTFTHTPTPNGNAPLGTGDYDDNRGIFGYYIHAVEPTSGCEVFDSVFVMVAHPYQVAATIDFLYPGPWCDSSDYTALDYAHRIEGFPSVPGGQYALLNITNGGDAPVIEWGLNGERYNDLPYDTLDVAGVLDGDTLRAWVTTSMYTCLSEQAEAQPVVLHLATRGDLYSLAPEKAQDGEEILLQSYVGNHNTPALGLGGYTYTYSLEQPDGSWQSLGEGSSQGRVDWLDSLLTTMPGRSGRFRVESHDQYNVCPVQHSYMDVALAVNTDIAIKAFDPATGREIQGICPQSSSFVYADGQPVPAGNAQMVVWVNDTREPIDVFIRTYPQNPGKNAYVGYWRNGTLRAIGPVGSSGTLVFDPDEDDQDYRVLEHGDTVTANIMPGDWFGAFYVHDTMSIDGQFISYSNRITLDADTSDKLVVSASATAVCPGQTVSLNADFANDNITWLPQGAYSSQNGAAASITVTESAVYTAVGFAANGCALRDSILVNTVLGDEKLPLSIKSDSLQFCGTEAWLRLEMSQDVSRAEDFTRFDWYAVEAGGDRLLESTTEPVLYCAVSDGMKIMAQAQSVLTCQNGLSQSDTLTFDGFEYPVLARQQPFLSDTSVCPLSDITIAYTVEPRNALVEWYAFVDNYNELLEDVTDNSFSYVADEDVRFEITAFNPDMPSCKVTDSVRVFVKQTDSYQLQISVEVDKDAVCGAEEVTYTASFNGDYLRWVANGELLDNLEQSLVRVPRFTGIYGDADSVYAVAVNYADECALADTAYSEPILVWRVEKPELHLLCSDTTVFENAPVLLSASATAFDGQGPLLTWHDSTGEPLAIDSNLIKYTLKNQAAGDYLYYVLAFQAEVAETLPYCYSYDSVRVKVEKELAVEDRADFVVSVNPNPTSGKFSLYTGVSCRVEIFSMTGARVWFADKVEGTREIELKVAGIYLIKATTPEGGTVVRKLVVR
ncbi:MAG: T9SS type A sorting domain-containing protein [Bacteroidales bacterium]|nr:T9SS type A sorting domain-containing protein [Bacteroidales bacterium]